MKLLIVDDHPIARKFIRDLMLSVTTDVVECVSGPEALQRYGEVQPDFVTMDLMMEGMSGIEATRLLRQAYPNARVIVVSAYADSATKLAALRAGALSFVSKGDLVELRDILRAADAELRRDAEVAK